MRRTHLLLTLVAAALVVAPPARAADPVITVPQQQLEQSLACSGSLAGARRTPVLLVHGTGSTPRESWRSGYAYALPREGHPTCTVRLPDRALDDIQIAVEHVVHAIREMAQRSGRRVSVVGHSQGGLHPVWALRFWTGLRGSVEDVIALASPFQGTAGADCDDPCQPAVWQQRQGSSFLEALNGGDLPRRPSFTSVATLGDQVVVPQPEASRLAGARNIVLQDVCPGRTVDHFSIIYDNVTYRLVLDALRNDGPADPRRLPAGICQTTSMPFNSTTFAADVSEGLANLVAAFATYRRVPEEPPLFCYADPSSPRGVGTTCPRAAQTRPQLRLRVSPAVTTAGRRVRLRFVTTAAGERVARVRIRIAGRTVRTNRNGRAALRVRFARPGVRRARATRSGYRAGAATVRVRSGQPRFTG